MLDFNDNIALGLLATFLISLVVELIVEYVARLFLGKPTSA
jgi:hypothetical protein